MKNLFKVSLLGLAVVGFNASASTEITSFELFDSSLINASEVSAINVFNNDSTIESLETKDGQVIHGALIKRIIFQKSFRPKLEIQAAAKVGGEGSGG